MQETKITEESRLKKWFLDHYPNLTLSHLMKLLRTGQIRVNAKRIKLNYTLKRNDMLRLPLFINSYEGNPDDKKIIKINVKDIALLESSIIYEDKDYIAINKPYGFAVQGGSNIKRSVIDIMSEIFKKRGEQSPRLVHRLDKETTGVLLLAKNLQAAQNIGKQLKEKTTNKIYYAVVAGELKTTKGEITAPMLKKNGKFGEMMQIDAKGQEARSEYEIMDRNARASFLKLTLKTGRTHQLRVHTAYIGHPIIGDDKYGNKELFSLDISNKNKLHLSARELSFCGMDSKKIKITAPLPDHILETLKELKLNIPN